MKRTKSEPGRVIGTMTDGEGTCKVEVSKYGRIRIIDGDPSPVDSECLLDYPRVEWPQSTRNPPSGQLITALFGDDGWRNFKLRDEVSKMIGQASEYLTTTHYLSSWTAPLCATLCCKDCPRSDVCETFSAECVRTTRGKKDSTAFVLRLDEFLLGQADPLERRLAPYFHGWTKLKHNNIRRAILILAILGKRGMRKGGYYKHDIAMIAGVHPKSYSSVNNIVDKLGDFGFLKRQRRRTKRPRFRYCYTGNWKTIQKAADDAARDYVRGDIIDTITREARGKFVAGNDYSDIGAGIMIGRQPPEFAVEIIQRLSELSIFSVFHGIIEPRLEARSMGKMFQNSEWERHYAQKVADEIEQLKSLCNSVSAEDARKWEEFRGELVAQASIGRGPLLVYNIPWIAEWVAR